MRAPLLIVSLLALAAAGVQAAELYKWTDEKGRVHYTDKPPPEQAKQVETRTVQPEPDTAPAAPAEAAKPDNAAKCAQLRQNLAVYEGSAEIEADTDGDGVAEPLSPERIERELQRTRDQIAKECGDG